MIIELNAFGCKDLIDVDEEMMLFKIVYRQYDNRKRSSKYISLEERVKNFTIDTIKFEWFGDTNDDGIPIFYVTGYETILNKHK